MQTGADKDMNTQQNSSIVSTQARSDHLQWLKELTQIPTAAGCEGRVIQWVKAWVAERDHLCMTSDDAGNLTIARVDECKTERPVYFTGHLDHPAFVVERILSPGAVEASFRGGVMEGYFDNAAVEIHTAEQVITGCVVEKLEAPDEPFKRYLIETEQDTSLVCLGDVCTWVLGPVRVEAGILYTNACDDLAAVAAALGALDVLSQSAQGDGPAVRVLLTLAEEIGFVGAIGACRGKTMPSDARVIALENSRSFADSPIGGGPIVRVGDRLSVFSPSLTGAVAKCAEALAGGPASVRATQKLSESPKWKWQRKLMAGGACEASAYHAFGYESTCICLPLGNYHNMADLDAVQAGTNEGQPRVGQEHIAVEDYHSLVELLVACGTSLPDVSPLIERFEKLWNEKCFVLGVDGD